jgi:hypothetical protein
MDSGQVQKSEVENILSRTIWIFGWFAKITKHPDRFFSEDRIRKSDRPGLKLVLMPDKEGQ